MPVPHPRSPIRARLFLYFAALTLAVALAVYLCLYYTMIPSLHATANEALRESARTHMQVIDQSIRAINGVSVNIVYSSKVRAAMEWMNEVGYLTYNGLRDVSDQLVTINGPMFPAAQIRLYSLSGRIVATGTINGQYEYSPEDTPWMAEVLAADGSKVLSAPMRDAMLVKRSDYIALRRVIKQSYRQPLGVVEVVADLNNILGSLYAESFMEYCVVNARGEVIYPLGGTLTRAVEHALESEDRSGMAALDDQLVAWHASDESDWVFVSVQPRSELLRPVYDMTRNTILIVAALLLAALMMSYLVARQFTRPIQALADRMHGFRLAGQEEAASDVPNLDELAVLGDSFNQLKARLNQSVDALLLSKQQELHSRMMALQSQMNPHFLHNALSNLEALIDIGEYEKASEMIAAMSRMLRYIASDAQPVVPLSEELRHVRDYIACMQLRYGKNLRCSIELDTLPEDTPVPKLSIQPLVENAVKHGCTTQPPWTIRVEISAYQQGWQASVCDNGAGFRAHTLETLLRQAEEIRKKGVLPGMEIDGMGLLNIAMRLKLYEGDDFLFHVQNLDGGGSRITIGSPGKRGNA